MTRQDLINKVSEETGIPAIQCREVVTATIAAMKESIASGRTIYIRGFGTFEPKYHPERKARDISRNEMIMVPARIKPDFKPSRDFTQMCNLKK